MKNKELDTNAVKEIVKRFFEHAAEQEQHLSKIDFLTELCKKNSYYGLGCNLPHCIKINEVKKLVQNDVISEEEIRLFSLNSIDKRSYETASNPRFEDLQAKRFDHLLLRTSPNNHAIHSLCFLLFAQFNVVAIIGYNELQNFEAIIETRSKNIDEWFDFKRSEIESSWIGEFWVPSFSPTEPILLPGNTDGPSSRRYLYYLDPCYYGHSIAFDIDPELEQRVFDSVTIDKET